MRFVANFVAHLVGTQPFRRSLRQSFSAKLRKEKSGQFEKPVEPAPEGDTWFHAKVVAENRQVKVFVNGAPEPSLVVNELSDRPGGSVGLWAGGYGAIANLKIMPATVQNAQFKDDFVDKSPRKNAFINVTGVIQIDAITPLRRVFAMHAKGEQPLAKRAGFQQLPQFGSADFHLFHVDQGLCDWLNGNAKLHQSTERSIFQIVGIAAKVGHAMGDAAPPMRMQALFEYACDNRLIMEHRILSHIAAGISQFPGGVRQEEQARRFDRAGGKDVTFGLVNGVLRRVASFGNLILQETHIEFGAARLRPSAGL
ncbi:MAG: hypothetical protein L0Z50_29915 [Verrucomicrobiales bacterium]|nr:hypothetical protein [Verrucomicrobiales bacterium]